jgi:hypothetical protein
VITQLIPSGDLRVGDSIVFLGQPHRVDWIEPYTGPLLDVLGAGTRIAHGHDGWGMTIEPHGTLTVVARGEVR